MLKKIHYGSIMFGVLFRGLSFGTSLIVAIGAQNAFVIRQGLTKKYLFLTAILCASIDAILILLGVFGFGAIVTKYPLMLSVAKYFAIAFLFGYGVLSLRAAFKNTHNSSDNLKLNPSVKKTILSILAFSLLNPHVYLDTVILMGSIAAQEAPSMQWLFALGAISASFLWFFFISYGASYCARRLQKPNWQRGIDMIVAFTMWVIALRLLVS